MKKLLKSSALVLALLMVCLSFSGCDDLDEIRSHHATFTNEGEYDSITYSGEVYKRIDGLNSDSLNPFYNDEYYEYINLTESNVPVLLSERFSDDAYVTSNGNFIEAYSVPDKYYYLYCKADMYDDIKSKIEAGINYSLYGYGYYYDDDNDMESKYGYYYLKPEEIEAVNKVLETVEPTTVDDSFYDNIEYYISVDTVSDDKLFGDSAFDICRDFNNNYTLMAYGLDEDRNYNVPSSLNKTFDEIIKAAISSDGYKQVYY